MLSAWPRKRRGRPCRHQDREAPRRGAAPQPSSRGRRTNLVTDDEWRAFQEVKAGIIGQKGEAAVARQLAHLGASALHDVILKDSRGLTQIDHLVLGLDAILVLETKSRAVCKARSGRRISRRARRGRTFRIRSDRTTVTARQRWRSWAIPLCSFAATSMRQEILPRGRVETSASAQPLAVRFGPLPFPAKRRVRRFSPTRRVPGGSLRKPALPALSGRRTFCESSSKRVWR